MIKFTAKLTDTEASTFIDLVTNNPTVMNKVTEGVYTSGLRKGIIIGAVSVILGFNLYIGYIALKDLHKKNK